MSLPSSVFATLITGLLAYLLLASVLVTLLSKLGIN